MRHNQNNGRRFRGRGNNGQGNNYGNNNNNGNRRLNPRVQIFDSNGPEVRIRGNAQQVCEKYQSLAKDAASAGDRVLAESYLQHAEHYQRMLNEAMEEYNRHQAQFQQQPSADGAADAMVDDTNGDVGENAGSNDGEMSAVAMPGAEQPQVDGMDDLDQGFLRGPQRGNKRGAPADGEAKKETRETEQV